MSKTLGVVVPDELLEEIEQVIKGTTFENTSQFIRAAIREKLDRDEGMKW